MINLLHLSFVPFVSLAGDPYVRAAKTRSSKVIQGTRQGITCVDQHIDLDLYYLHEQVIHHNVSRGLSKTVKLYRGNPAELEKTDIIPLPYAINRLFWVSDFERR